MRDSATHRLSRATPSPSCARRALPYGDEWVTYVARGRDLAGGRGVGKRPSPPLDAWNWTWPRSYERGSGRLATRGLWVVCRFDPSRLHVARVRSDVARAATCGIERPASPERLILELAVSRSARRADLGGRRPGDGYLLEHSPCSTRVSSACARRRA